jgi:ubiquitin carboxyl-terminal hydrolase 4/11/15
MVAVDISEKSASMSDTPPGWHRVVSVDEVEEIRSSIDQEKRPSSLREIWYILPFEWFEDLFTFHRVTHIVNSVLLQDPSDLVSVDELTSLDPSKFEKIDFVVVGPNTWKLILALSQCHNFHIDVVIPRFVYRKNYSFKLYIHPIHISVQYLDSPPRSAVISPDTTLRDLVDSVVHSSSSFATDQYVVEVKSDFSFFPLNPAFVDRLALEVPAINEGAFLRVSPPRTNFVALPMFPISSSPPLSLPAPAPADLFGSLSPPLFRRPAVEPGQVGLRNLGNTCFMNSAIQCLGHTKKLVKLFLDVDAINRNLNRDNVLGYGGKLALEFAKVVQGMWRPSSFGGVYTPSELKHLIGEHAPQFSGYQQHDAQELLAFLLDGLHEDLNRVRAKPYFGDTPEAAEPQPDEEAASEAWSRHLARNQSEIVDLFQGQFKSRLTCPVCNHSSITFDPFMYLSLPLPRPPRLWKVTAAAFDGQIRKFEVRSSLEEIREKIATHLGTISDYIAMFPNTSSDFCPEFNPESVASSNATLHVFVWRHHRPLSDAGANFVVIVPRRRRPVVAVAAVDENDDLYEGPKMLMSPSPGGDEGAVVGAPVVLPVDVESEKVSQILRRAKFAVAEQFRREGGIEGELVFRAGHDGGGEVVDFEDERRVAEGVTYITMEVDESWQLKEVATEFSWSREEESDKKRTLEECVEIFSSEEILGEEDRWYCGRCKDFVRAKKKMEIWRLPETLVIHLKRFEVIEHRRRKISIPIKFPIEETLDLELFVTGPDKRNTKFRLYAVSAHTGSLFAGHYYAHARVQSPCGDDSWFTFNDSTVSREERGLAELGDSVASSAYLLFYERVVDDQTTQQMQF